MTNKQFNTIFSAFILIGMAAALVLTTFLKFSDAQTTYDRAILLVSAVGALTGILATVTGANGKIITFLFGTIDVVIYSMMCIINHSYGTAAMHLLYLLPMQFVGIYQWKKRGASRKSEVKPRRLGARQWALAAGVFLVASAVAYVVLLQFNEEAAGKFFVAAVLTDALVTVCNIFGQFLMSTAYAEQWFFWIGVNISSITMWSIALGKPETADFALIYVVKYCFYLLNAINGLRNWLQRSR